MLIQHSIYAALKVEDLSTGTEIEDLEVCIFYLQVTRVGIEYLNLILLPIHLLFIIQTQLAVRCSGINEVFLRSEIKSF